MFISRFVLHVHNSPFRNLIDSQAQARQTFQADLKAFAANNVPQTLAALMVDIQDKCNYCLTSHNTTGVSDIHVITTDFVCKQIHDVISDIPPKCINAGTSHLSLINEGMPEVQKSFIWSQMY